MSSKKQKRANRKNAQQSTGPQTVAGKATVSQNALRHGLTAKQTVMPWESQAAFDAYAQGLMGYFRPQTPLETDLVERIISAGWRLKRIDVFEAQAMAQSGEADMTGYLQAVTFKLRRYESSLRRQRRQDQAELMDLQAMRWQIEDLAPGEPVNPADVHLAMVVSQIPDPQPSSPEALEEPAEVVPFELPAPTISAMAAPVEFPPLPADMPMPEFRALAQQAAQDFGLDIGFVLQMPQNPPQASL